MRLLNAAIPVAPKFNVAEMIPIVTHKQMAGGRSQYMPHVRLGFPQRGRITSHCIPLGSRYLTMVSTSVPCEREGEAIFGFCPKCHADVAGNRIRKVEETVSGFFTTVREVGKHDPYRAVNPVSKGLFFLTKDKGTLMLVEERIDDKQDLGMVLKVFGCKVTVDVSSANEEYKKISEKVTGEYWNGPNLVAIDKILALTNGDRVRIERQLPSGREEELLIEVKAQWPRIISAKILKDPAKTVASVPEAESKPSEEPAAETVPADPVVEATIDKVISDIKQEESAVEVESIRQMFRHVNDLKRIERIREVAGQEVGTEDLIKVLVEPIKTMAKLPLIPEHEGRQFVFRFGKDGEMKLVGDVVECGLLRLKTVYGRGNPVDKERESVDLTPKA